MEGRSAQRLAAMVAMQQQNNDALRSAQAVVDQHTQWILSHLSAADRELIESVTGETIAPGADSASVFALTLAESRVSKAQASAASASHMMMRRPQSLAQHDRVATFTSMRAVLGANAVGRSLDTEA
jgi:hypothetical protein